MKLTYNTEIPENVLKEILLLIPETPTQLTTDLIDSIREVLYKVGVVCETREELLECLNILDELDLIHLKEIFDSDYVTYSIYRKYNE